MNSSSSTIRRIDRIATGLLAAVLLALAGGCTTDPETPAEIPCGATPPAESVFLIARTQTFSGGARTTARDTVIRRMLDSATVLGSVGSLQHYHVFSVVASGYDHVDSLWYLLGGDVHFTFLPPPYECPTHLPAEVRLPVCTHASFGDTVELCDATVDGATVRRHMVWLSSYVRREGVVLSGSALSCDRVRLKVWYFNTSPGAGTAAHDSSTFDYWFARSIGGFVRRERHGASDGQERLHLQGADSTGLEVILAYTPEP